MEVIKFNYPAIYLSVKTTSFLEPQMPLESNGRLRGFSMEKYKVFSYL